MQLEFGPYGLPGYGTELDAPPVRQRLDEEQPTSGVALGAGRLEAWEALAPGVRHLDTEDIRLRQEPEPEAPAGDPAVRRRVRGEFGDDLRGGLPHAVRHLVIPHPLDGEQACQSCPAWRGRQEDGEVAFGRKDLSGVLLIHVTERGRPRLP